MLKYYFKLSARFLFKARVFTLINLLGLAVAIMACFTIYIYVKTEFSYDDSTIAHRVYRVQNNYIRNNELIYESAATFPGVAPMIKDNFPQVERIGRFYPWGMRVNCILTNEASGPISFNERLLAYADPEIVELLDFKIIRGQGRSSLEEPNKVLISESTSKRYFNDKDPIGKILRFDDENGHRDLLEVAGVFMDRPLNTHLRNDILISYKTLYNRKSYRSWEPTKQGYEEDLGDYSFYTYMQIQEDFPIDSIASQMPELFDKYKPSYLPTDSDGNRIRRNDFNFTRLDIIHLESHRSNELNINGNKAQVNFMIIIAVFIMVLAWVNFTNLTTSRAAERASEVGIRKILGSQKFSLILQFLSESIAVNILALVLAIALLEVGTSFIREFLSFEFFSLSGHSNSFWIWFILIIGLGAILSGLYPAIIIASLTPSSILKGKMKSSGQSKTFRRSLVVFQFFISIGLLSASIVIFSQMKFALNKPLGFNKDQILVIERPAYTSNSASDPIQFFKQNLLRNEFVQNVTKSTSIPGKNIFRGMAISKNLTPDRTLDDVRSIKDVYVDEDFVETYQMKLVAGNDFPKNRMEGTNYIILNKSAVEELGFKSNEEATNSIVAMGGNEYIVSGIIEDYHHTSIHSAREPMVFALNDHDPAYISIRLSSSNLNKNLEEISAAFSTSFPGNPFEYFFLDDFFQRQYTADQQFQGAMELFTSLAIFLACIGLFGLSSYNTLQRSKEIVVRKVLGASRLGIIKLILKEYLLMILIAGLISFPASYFLLQSWLADFAYKISLQGWEFLLPIAGVSLIAIMTIGYQTLKSARANPAQVLRYE